MLSKCRVFRPQLWRRLARPFCAKLPAAPQGPDRGSQEFQEQRVSLDGNKLTVKFNENTVCYELPDRVGGTTFGRVC
jgi:hypothetical protein